MQTTYRPGDVANGHVLGGDNIWRPVPNPQTLKRQSRRGVFLALGIVGGIVAVIALVGLIPETGSAATPLETADKLAGSPYTQVADGGRTLIIDGWGDESVGVSTAIYVRMLNSLDTPASVVARMDSTRALDGTQEASWGDFSASWTYHPDAGLDMVITED